MNYRLQIILLIVILICFYISVKNIKKQNLRIEYSVVWFLCLVGLGAITIFPSIPSLIAELLGIRTTINAILVIIIFVLGCLLYYLYIKTSKIEETVKNIVQDISIYIGENNNEE